MPVHIVTIPAFVKLFLLLVTTGLLFYFGFPSLYLLNKRGVISSRGIPSIIGSIQVKKFLGSIWWLGYISVW